MELRPGLSALVTGGASGIGRALVLALAQKGVFVTVVDFSQDKGEQVASLAEKEVSKFHSRLEFAPALFIKCDVTDSNELTAAFENHVKTYGGLDICINCAGIATPVPFYQDKTDGAKSWRRAVDVNFVAVIDSTRLAIRAMQEAKRPAVIINVGSASGLYPMYPDPIYSGSKGGVVLFTRSLAPYKRQGIRINVLCPEVNFSSGRYFGGGNKDISSLLPFDAGFEGVGIIAAIGDSVKHLKVGTPAAIMTFGSYAEFTTYQGEQGWKPRAYTGLCEKILAKSQTVAGFFLVQYAHLWQQHLDKLVDLYSSGKLKVAVDPKPFLGIRSVADAVDYLHSGKSVGKVVVCIDPTFGHHPAKL
ncbi:UNVERIFIED_CONTAM: 3-beta-hydroxycholanate 3-dehydrogenase (NAD(+)) 2 [Sesamum latifolium]|uniref:3-beta-hydroxycholanate 3-dehydrogenase (NAD(+)) 2 n=1 Tax=Sesamum latifolium TaxID=2727402 RepID=A0AAW2V1Z3_9LAMI